MDSNTKFTQIMRQTLLRQFSEQDAAFLNFYCREEGLALFKKLSSQKTTSGYIFRKRELVNHLVKAGIQCNVHDDDNFIRECVDKLPKVDVMERRLMDILYGVYVKALSPTEQIELIVRKLGRPEYRECSVRLAILKQFIVNTACYTKAIVTEIKNRHGDGSDGVVYNYKDPEVVAQLADESLFDILDRKLDKDQRKAFTLLRYADDIANGRFRSNGGTRKALYLFAFAFEMCAYIDPNEDEYDADRDIEKNLFFDYYGNSLLRFVSEDYVSHSSDYEAEPSGEGINYKNYNEAINIYYLNRKDLSPVERFSRAAALTEKCREYAELNGDGKIRRKHDSSMNINLDVSTKERYTHLYRDLYMIMQLRSMNEDEMVKFICDYFEIGGKQTSTAHIAVASDARTAAKHIKELNPKDNEGNDNWWGGTDGESLAESYKKQMSVLCAPYGDRKFTEIVEKMCDMLFETHDEKHDTVPQNVSRRRMISLAFNEFMNMQESDKMSMLELYGQFSEWVNKKLRDSRYQPICPTNIFDMFVILLLYMNLNIV